MNAPLECVDLAARVVQYQELEELESKAIRALRALAESRRSAVLLFSGGKRSLVLLRLAEKAFPGERFPFRLLYLDRGREFDEIAAFRAHRAAELGQQVIVARALDEVEFDAAIEGSWRPHRPEFPNGRSKRLPVFPLESWTELSVWRYIELESIELPSLYYPHWRHVVRRGGEVVAITPLAPARPGEAIEQCVVHFRSIQEIARYSLREAGARGLPADGWARCCASLRPARPWA